jgi:outer membrane protein, multidrug efflux system
VERLRIAFLAGGVCVAGCMVGPNYREPEAQVAKEYKHAVTSAPAGEPTTRPATQPAARSTVASGPPASDYWWSSLRDPLLDSLVSQAMQANLDLQTAEARIREARAQRQVLFADLWPQVGVGTSYQYSGHSLNASPKVSTPKFKNRVLSGTVGNLGATAADAVTTGGAIGGGGSLPNQLAGTAIRQGASQLQNRISKTSVSRDINLFQAGFDAAWELDVFGGTRRAIEAADAEIQAAEEDLHDLQTTLISEVARNYLEARGFQKRLQIARENVKLQQDTLELTRAKRRAGLSAELDVAQAAAQLANTESTVPAFESFWYQSIHRVSVLLGREPEAVEDQLEQTAPIPATPPIVPVGLPSELLRRRPDIRRAERVLAAATASIGVATADLFPRFSITGSFGTDTRDFRHILDYNSFTWGVGPSVRWPLFDGGRIRANIEVQNARQVQALYQYRSTILVALEEVEDALVAYRQEQERYAQLEKAVQANRVAVELANQRYMNGVTSFLSLLVTQAALFATDDQRVQSEVAVVANYIALNKALGGGWQIMPEGPNPPVGPVIRPVDLSPALSLILEPPKFGD